MSIDVNSEDLLTLRDARSEFPGGRRLGLATIQRWRLHGVRGVKLETLLIGGSRYTSREAIARFIAAQNGADTAAVDAAVAVTPARRRRQAEAARAELERAGI